MFRSPLARGGRSYSTATDVKGKFGYLGWVLGHTIIGGIGGATFGFVDGFKEGITAIDNPVAKVLITPALTVTLTVSETIVFGVCGAFAGFTFGALSPITYPYAMYVLHRKR